MKNEAEVYAEAELEQVAHGCDDWRHTRPSRAAPIPQPLGATSHHLHDQVTPTLDTVPNPAYTAHHACLFVQPEHATSCMEGIHMYNKPTLSLDQVQKAMAAMVEQATQKPDQPVAIAIVDDVGNLLSYARMDRCRVIPQRLAIRKAYTSALSGQDSRAYAERLKSQGRSVAEMGDPNLAAVQGGVVVLHPGTGSILGGIGVSGLSAQEDEDLARLGLQTLGL
jgi:glc operon protein GlcG